MVPLALRVRTWKAEVLSKSWPYFLVIEKSCAWLGLKRGVGAGFGSYGTLLGMELPGLDPAAEVPFMSYSAALMGIYLGSRHVG
jgi:hypothetical protein